MNEWLRAVEAAEILGIHFHSVIRAGRQGQLVTRQVPMKGFPNRFVWEFNRSSVEARRERMNAQPPEEISNEWLPIAQAQMMLKMTRHGVKRRIKMGLLESNHFGPPEALALYVNRAQVVQQSKHRPAHVRQQEWQEIPAEEAFQIWFAGFFDGEGCILIRRSDRGKRSYWQLDLNLPNSAIEAVLEIEAQIGGKSYDRPRQKPHYRDQRVWEAHADEAMTILKAIRPHLRAKHQQADLAIQFQERVRSHSYNRWDTIPQEERDWRNEQMRRISVLNRPNVKRD